MQTHTFTHFYTHLHTLTHIYTQTQTHRQTFHSQIHFVHEPTKIIRIKRSQTPTESIICIRSTPLNNFLFTENTYNRQLSSENNFLNIFRNSCPENHINLFAVDDSQTRQHDSVAVCVCECVSSPAPPQLE